MDIDVFEDAGLRVRMVRWSLVMLAAGFVGAVVTGAVTGGRARSLLNPWWWAALFGGSVAALPVHELVHALAFKLACPGCHVSFGFQDAFLYTRTEGVVTTRSRMALVLAAPAVVVTLGLVALALAAACPALAVLLAATHLSGCVGDLLMVRAIALEPACTHVEDTDFGITLLSDAR